MIIRLPIAPTAPEAMKKARFFDKEAKFKQWLKDILPVWTVENGVGGTVGFPDVVTVYERVVFLFELKISNANLQFNATPEQINLLEELQENGVNAFIFGAIKGKNVLFLVKSEAVSRISKGKRPRYEPDYSKVLLFAGTDFEHFLGLIVKNGFTETLERQRKRLGAIKSG